MDIPDMGEFNRGVVERFRAQHGEGPIGELLHAERLVLLTHTGRRTGVRRTTPMGFLRLSGRLFVVASGNGAPRDPDWFRNAVAHPLVGVELGAESYPATAVAAGPAEYDRLWAEALGLWPFLAEHRERAGRTIPLLELVRTEG